MTSTQIEMALHHYLDGRKTVFFFPNSFMYNWECDVWTLDTDGLTREFEIKISRNDFLRDGKKPKHMSMSHGIECANYFYYVCPRAIIQPNEVPGKAGLIYIEPHGSPTIIKSQKNYMVACLPIGKE